MSQPGGPTVWKCLRGSNPNPKEGKCTHTTSDGAQAPSAVVPSLVLPEEMKPCPPRRALWRPHSQSLLVP